jgi:hypothetical protein
MDVPVSKSADPEVGPLPPDQRREGNGSAPPDRMGTTATALAYITTFGFFALIFLLIYFPNTSQSPYKDILLTMMGIVGTAWAGIIGFYFGSSVGSQRQLQARLQEGK